MCGLDWLGDAPEAALFDPVGRSTVVTTGVGTSCIQ